MYSVYFDNDVVKSKYGINEQTAKEKYQIIKTALKRLETLEEDFMSLTETNMELVQEVSRNRKKLKALEIIKRNPLMICAEYYKCIVELKLTYQEFLEYFPNEEDRAIKTQEEYDLLKEMLKNE